MTDIGLSHDDEVQVRRAVKLLKMRRSTDKLAMLAAEKKLKRVPERILTLANERREHGTEEKRRPNETNELPSMARLSPMEQTLMTGALEQDSVDEAVRQIYDNMHKLTGWQYNASITDISGPSYTKGGKTVGMCESYRNAFAEALKCYDMLRKTHPNNHVRRASLNIELGNTLAPDRFCTRRGLTLMGNGLKGNVYLEVDGRGNPLNKGIDDINKFVFKGHWTLKVNGVEYDPIFYSIGEDNVAQMLNASYEADGGRFIANPGAPIPTGEFGATFVWVSDWAQFQSTVATMKSLYEKHKKDVDAILSGEKEPREGIISKTDRKCYSEAKKVAKNGVDDQATFRQVVDDASRFLKASDVTAVGKILDLAGI